MKLFEEIHGTIASVNSKGQGIFEHGGKEILTPFSVPGDDMTVTLTSRKKGQLHGRIKTIHSPSHDRVRPLCPYAGQCGGCVWQMIDYQKQLELKKDLINKTFADHQLDLQIDSVEPAVEQFYFRNRMDYVFGQNGELGLKEPERWWSVLNLSTCFLLSEESVQILELVRHWMKKWNLPPWNNKKYHGLLRYLVIREGKNTGERMITLITSAEDFPAPTREELITTLQNHCTTLYWGINPLITDLSIASELHLLSGNQYLTEEINGFRYQIHPNSFFQTNSNMAAKLMKTVGDFAALTKTDRLLDIYCGLGFFAIGLGGAAKEAFGIELDAPAIELAKSNAQLNNISNVQFFAGATEALLETMPKPDVVIVDPPRSGLHPKALATLLAFAPKRIVYVSCNYQSLVKELPEFLKTYTVARLRALDLFPHTPHVEVVTCFEKI